MKSTSLAAIGIAFAAAFGPLAVQAQTVKVAFIDPMSGPLAATTQNQRRNIDETLAYLRKRDKWPDDFKFEVVPFDNKNEPQTSLIQLNKAVNEGYRFILQGLSSSVSHAMIEGVNKYNERNPGKEILLLNPTSTDTELTNEKCSFWHFRFEPNTDMKAEATTSQIVQNMPEVKKIYLINANYAMGQATSKALKELLKRKKPSLEIVGDDLVPFNQVKDYSPYVAKIKASGADLVVTSLFGPDIIGILKAARDAGIKTKMFTYYAHNRGVAGSLGDAFVGQVYNTTLWNPNNPPDFKGSELLTAFRKKYPGDDINVPNIPNVFAMVAAAVLKAKSTEPVKVAYAMEGMKMNGLADEIEMRKSDHQLQQPLYVTTYVKVDGKDKDLKFDTDGSGYGWKTIKRLDAFVASQPTSCQMKRP
ncbi:MAG TPA: branched-chain amino acid ABC transporter substrate-binding protein [Ramlibacter sp.]|uniref:branched-chain amino acid ABC transporter substrate-binding protein n=1 Tax=Ramlibacter sp. TaxID=1917967 RepID=UPI002D00251B|nr:branched-chain amino acid ABC transporter substrate-binding protein [Ramlibacter sp.]HVZ45797.1 branched-chain amino acid ABC transporter substrate-binding protein [Ramlibacter sp.]